ncbi:hypothetical protein Forpi1262_v015296 [Fusarium oxysporum f. sp. raphani]|uniref:Uncharacterized protein n=1 Tax=Fusarium oxysporum f. sp. raphani TaxID=96318 RepID=A0A8J5PGP6_FUSOX|nr:hypothetical protein Forpi1262_v015296 [Fusarium oxysporum f. sp. raphani]
MDTSQIGQQQPTHLQVTGATVDTMETGAVISHSSPDELDTAIPGCNAINSPNGAESDYFDESDDMSTLSMALRRTIEAELAANGDNTISEVDNRPRDALQMSTCDGAGTFDRSSIGMSESESHQAPESIRSPSNDPSCITPTASMVSRVQIHDTPRHICEYGVDMDAD